MFKNLAILITVMLTTSAAHTSVGKIDITCQTPGKKGRLTTLKVFDYSVTYQSCDEANNCTTGKRVYGAFGLSGLQICGSLYGVGECEGQASDQNARPFLMEIKCRPGRSSQHASVTRFHLDQNGIGHFICLRDGDLLGEDRIDNCHFEKR